MLADPPEKPKENKSEALLKLKHLEELVSKLKSIKEQLPDISDRVKELISKLNPIQEQLLDIDEGDKELVSKLKSIEGQLPDIDEEITGLVLKLESIEEQLPGIADSFEAFASEELVSKIKSIQGQLPDIAEAIEALDTLAKSKQILWDQCPVFKSYIEGLTAQLKQRQTNLNEELEGLKKDAIKLHGYKGIKKTTNLGIPVDLVLDTLGTDDLEGYLSAIATHWCYFDTNRIRAIKKQLQTLNIKDFSFTEVGYFILLIKHISKNERSRYLQKLIDKLNQCKKDDCKEGGALSQALTEYSDVILELLKNEKLTNQFALSAMLNCCGTSVSDAIVERIVGKLNELRTSAVPELLATLMNYYSGVQIREYLIYNFGVIREARDMIITEKGKHELKICDTLEELETQNFIMQKFGLVGITVGTNALAHYLLYSDDSQYPLSKIAVVWMMSALSMFWNLNH